MNVPLVFVRRVVIALVGGLMTAVVLFTSLPTTALMVLAGVAGLALIISCRRSTESRDTAILIVASVIIFAYFIRYFIVAADAELIYFLVPPIGWPAFHSHTILDAAIRYATAAFIAFCASAMIFRPMPRLSQLNRAAGTAWRVPSSLVLALTVVALVILDLLMLTFGIGQQGKFVESPLPFKLTGAIAYSKTVVVPCLLGVCIYMAQHEGKSVRARATVAVLLCSAAVDMVMLSSRGALLNQVLFVALIWLMAGFKIRKTDVFLISGAVCAALFVVPIVTALRLFDASLQGMSLQQIYVGVTFVMFRITGIDQFMIILDLSAPLPLERVLSVLSSSRGVAGYYTVDILGVSESIPQTFAPSGIGWLYIVGGGAAVIGGAVFLAFFVVHAWKALDALVPRLAPVARALVVWQLIVVITEGVVGVVMTIMAIGLITLWLTERFLMQDAHGRDGFVVRRAHLLRRAL